MTNNIEQATYQQRSFTKQEITQRNNVLRQFHKRLVKERFVNSQSSAYYSSQNSKFVIPGILITGISSVISFMGSSDLLSSTAKSGIAIGVGVFTVGATVLQSISGSFGFQSRTEAFQKAADSYDTLITKVEFEISNPNEDFNEFCNDLETAILDIKNNCKYFPPLFIYKLWEANKKQETELDKMISDAESNSFDKPGNSQSNKHLNTVNDTIIPIDNIIQPQQSQQPQQSHQPQNKQPQNKQQLDTDSFLVHITNDND
jgi:hypothetical protein